MQDFIPFLLRHWAWALGFIAVLGIVLGFELQSKRSQSKISTHKLVDLVNRDDARVLDTRDVDIFKKGHIAGALNIPRDQLTGQIKKLSSHRDKPVVVVCAAGVSAVQTAAELRKEGFSKVHVLANGMNGWRQANMPVVAS